MERTVNTLFYHFNQNNSGGYFVKDDKFGICEDVIIEALSAEDAWNKLLDIGKNVEGFNDWCLCCEERWYPCSKDDGTEIPMIYSTPVEKQTKDIFRPRAFVHYFDGTKKEFIFKAK